MHCNFFSAPRSIAFDDSLESLTVFLPYLFFLSAETDIFLDCLRKTERSLALCGTVEESFLLVSDKSVEDLLELSAISVCIEGETRERNDRLSEKSGLKP